jgi:regulator of protease activity HflC (stomatin/prohibitin superfamily)
LHEQLCQQRKLREIALTEENAKAEEEAEARRALQEAEELQAQEEARVKALLVQQYKDARRKEQEVRDAEATRLRIEYETVQTFTYHTQTLLILYYIINNFNPFLAIEREHRKKSTKCRASGGVYFSIFL